MTRLYHHYEKWEEIAGGMWRAVHGEARKPLLDAAALLMKDTARFRTAMLHASHEWRYSCEVHLSGGYNRQAWIGHAGCCLAVHSPEDITRQAWHTLKQAEQDDANQAADAVLLDWDGRNA